MSPGDRATADCAKNDPSRHELGKRRVTAVSVVPGYRMDVPSGDALHVWTVDLRCTAQDLERLATVLSKDEHARAAGFRFEHHRRRFVVRRAALRSILGAYGSVAPSAVDYRPGPWGKLELATADVSPLCFNASHSNDWALVAVTTRHRVGVDIEMVRDIAEQDDIERRFFSPAEVNELGGLEGPARVLGFYLAWTRKEALIKAIGLGLHMPLDCFDVTVVPGQPAAVLRIDRDADAARTWTMLQPDAPAGFVAAVAVDHPIGEVAEREWEWAEERP